MTRRRGSSSSRKPRAFFRERGMGWTCWTLRLLEHSHLLQSTSADARYGHKPTEGGTGAIWAGWTRFDIVSNPKDLPITRPRSWLQYNEMTDHANRLKQKMNSSSDCNGCGYPRDCLDPTPQWRHAVKALRWSGHCWRAGCTVRHCGEYPG